MDIHLTFFALGGSWQRNDAKDSRTYPLGKRLDRSALAGTIAPLKDDADLGAGLLYPHLQLDQLDMKTLKLFAVILVA